MKKVKHYAPAIILFLVVLAVWQAYVSFGFIAQRVLPAPSTVFSSLYDSKAIIFDHALTTILEILIGLGVSIIFAIAVAVIIFLVLPARKALYPHLVASQTIPIIALAPLLLIWFGFGIVPKIIVIVIYSFFPITVSLADGLLRSPKHLVDYMKSQGASKLQILRYVNFPAALPSFFTGLKIGAVYSVTGAVVSEFLGAYKGLGVYLQTSAYSYATAQVFAVIVVIMLISFVLLGTVLAVEKIATPWRQVKNE